MCCCDLDHVLVHFLHFIYEPWLEVYSLRRNDFLCLLPEVLPAREFLKSNFKSLMNFCFIYFLSKNQQISNVAMNSRDKAIWGYTLVLNYYNSFLPMDALNVKSKLPSWLCRTGLFGILKGCSPEFDLEWTESLLSCFTDSSRYLESFRSNACLRMDLSP